MKLALDINGEQIEVDFTTATGSAALTVRDQHFKAEVSQPEDGLFVVAIEGRIYRCMVDRTPAGEMEITVNGRRLAIAVRDLKHLRGGHGSGATGDGPASLVAPMPGKVVRILCVEGDEVTAGQGVLIVEAMKMQNEVQSPRPGRVAQIRVKDGQTVNSGEVLAIIN